MAETTQVAVIGCGAISESYYFPALARMPGWRARTWLIDPSEARRRDAIRAFGFDERQQGAQVSDLPAQVNAAINATPSHLHVPTTLALIERSISVLVEKPLAENAADAQRLVDSAASAGCLLAVNQFRRLRPINRLTKTLLSGGELGTIRRISWSEGHKFDWPTQSGFYFRRPWPEGRPRGALLDIGAHVLDLLCWWLDCRPTVVEAVMDSQGGPEAYVRAILEAREAKIDIQISFHAKMANRFLIEGDAGSLSGSTVDAHKVELKTAGRVRHVAVGGDGDWTVIARAVVGNFLSAVAGEADLDIDAASVVRPLEVIDEIYAKAVDPLPSCYREWVA